MSAEVGTRPEKYASEGPTSPLPGASMAMALLLLINLFNYIDRQVLAAVEPNIRRELFPEADQPGAGDEVKAMARGRMGLLSTAFLLAYMIVAPLFGFLAHRVSRWLLISTGVVIWSLASGASGWEWGPSLIFGYWMLFLTRCFVGVGEGAYGPIAPTVLSDLFPIKSRGMVMSLFYLAIPVGGALGYTLGDIVANKTSLGWRWAFILVVIPGLLLGLWAFLMKDPPPGASDAEAPSRRLKWADYLTLLRTPSYVLNTLGMAAMTFAIGGLAFWMPDYLDWRKAGDVFGMPAKAFFGALTALSGLLATLAGGWCGDRLRARWSGSYFLVSGAAMLVAFPMILLLIVTPFPWAWIWLFFAVFCLFFNTGPTNTILANVTHPSIRASGFAINIFMIHILGDVPSPPLMGAIAGYTNQNVDFVVVSVAVLIGGVLWLCGTRYLAHDTALAPTRLSQ